MKDDISRNEVSVYGQRWHTVHDGYFADPEVALPYLDVISRAILRCQPDILADLGGGTGFILHELAKRHPKSSLKYINVDISPEQIEECQYSDITSLQASAVEITRQALVQNKGSLMLIMRSLLHYLGDSGAEPFLRHLRFQMRPGETLVHQTACFTSLAEADCANYLYTLMRTPKWYPTAASLLQTLHTTGWEVVDCQPASNLCLKSEDLAERYQLSPQDIRQICQEMRRKHLRPSVFRPAESNFTAFLHYRIFTCQAR
jgi:SAM-dependent methyltransferase